VELSGFVFATLGKSFSIKRPGVIIYTSRNPYHHEHALSNPTTIDASAERTSNQVINT